MKYVYFCWFFLLARNYISSVYSYETFYNRPVFRGAKISDMKTKTQIFSNRFCKSIYSPREAEKLLNYESTHVRRRGSWWKRSLGAGVLNPICSTYPNASSSKRTSGSSRIPISRAQFFATIGVDIPVKPGRMVSYPVTFEHIRTRKRVWRRILECDCTVMSDEVTNRNICDYGGTVHLSRGVGGDRSFFVYVYNSFTDFKVVAHICFNQKF